MADLRSLAAPFWQGENRNSAILWATGTLLLSLFSTAYAVTISFVNKFFWNALSAKDVPKYNKFLLIYIVCLSLGPPFLVLYDWFKARMALAWRTALTERFLGNYINDKKYYKIPIVASLDNADQRIADDIRAVTDKAVSLLCTVFVAACDLVVFSAVLYRIDPLLYVLLFGYAAAGTAITIAVGRPLIGLNREQVPPYNIHQERH
jgi:putative ATP-binding cassette transporter